MESYILDWAGLLLRWLHVITAIAWVGSSFYFVFLDSSLTPPVDDDLKKQPRRPASRLALRKRSMNCSALPTADSGSSGMSMHHHHGQVDCRCQRRQGQRALWPRGLPRDHQPRATHAGLAARAEPGRGRSLAGGAGRGLFAAQVSSEK